jgi:hypothetical protein
MSMSAKAGRVPYPDTRAVKKRPSSCDSWSASLISLVSLVSFHLDACKKCVGIYMYFRSPPARFLYHGMISRIPNTIIPVSWSLTKRCPHTRATQRRFGAYLCVPSARLASFTLNTTTPNGELELSSRTQRLDVVVFETTQHLPLTT